MPTRTQCFGDILTIALAKKECNVVLRHQTGLNLEKRKTKKCFKMIDTFPQPDKTKTKIIILVVFNIMYTPSYLDIYIARTNVSVGLTTKKAQQI